MKPASPASAVRTASRWAGARGRGAVQAMVESGRAMVQVLPSTPVSVPRSVWKARPVVAGVTRRLTWWGMAAISSVPVPVVA